MNTPLRSLFLLSFFMVMGLSNAQTVTPHDSLHKKNDNVVPHLEVDVVYEKVFSYNHEVIKKTEHHEGHDHGNEIALIDVLSSENHSDFNCSGGFCMNRSHCHKKGLPSRRQLFKYFMNITC